MGRRPSHPGDPAAAEPAGNRVVVEGERTGRARRERSAVSRHVDLRRPAVSLTAADVAEILKLIEESTFDELTLEIDGIKLTLRRGGGSGAPEVAATTAATQPAGAAAPAQRVAAGSGH